MKVKKVVKKLEDVNPDLNIEVKHFGPGNWINHVNDEWITTRVYVSIGDGSDFPSDFLEKVVKRINKKSLKSNIEIYIR